MRGGVKHSERTGLLLAIGGFAVLSVGDGVIKSMTGDWPVTAIAALRFVIGSIGLSILLAMQEGWRAFRPAKPGIHVARGLCLALTSLAFFSAISVLPLAETMAITFVSPVLTAILAGPLLGERVRPPVWIASLAALTGVLLILRPNLTELGLPALWPLASALFFSLMIILNRATMGQGSALSMQVFISIPATVILLAAAFLGRELGIAELAFGWPRWDIAARCAIVALTASTAHYLIYHGTSRAGAAQIAPATYVQMLVATVIGWRFFGDVPDAPTILGAAIIIGSGLYLWRYGRTKEVLFAAE